MLSCAYRIMLHSSSVGNSNFRRKNFHDMSYTKKFLFISFIRILACLCTCIGIVLGRQFIRYICLDKGRARFNIILSIVIRINLVTRDGSNICL